MKRSRIACFLLVFLLAACTPKTIEGISATTASGYTSTIPNQVPTRVKTGTPSRTPQLTLIPLLTSTSTPSPTPRMVGPFQVIASLPDMQNDSSGQVQVRALDDGSVWVIMPQKILRWNGTSWKELLSSRDNILATVDDSGQLWVLYPEIKEISALHGQDWFTYGAGKGWIAIGNFINSGWYPSPWEIYRDKQGKLWVPMEKDVRSFNGERWTQYTLEDMGFPSPEMEDLIIIHQLILPEKNNAVWVGECYYSGPGPMGGGGVRWFDGENWYGNNAPVGSNCVSAMENDLAGNVWLGASTDIWRFDYSNQGWMQYSLPKAQLSGFNFAYPTQLVVDGVGDAWVIMEMCGGASCGVATNVYRIHDGEWSLVLEAADWSSSFRKLLLDENGQAWLFWENLVYRLDSDPLEPLASISTRGVGVGPDGAMWVVAKS